MTLRAKLTLGSVALATVLVTLISAVSFANLMQLKFRDQLAFTELIKQHATDAVIDSLNRQRTIDLAEAVRDPALNQRLKDVMASYNAILDIMLVSADSNVVLTSVLGRLPPGTVAYPEPPLLAPLAKGGWWKQALALMENDLQAYRVDLAVGPGGTASIYVRVLTNLTLINHELEGPFRATVVLAAICITGSVLITFLVSAFALRPLAAISRMLDLVARGEYEAEKATPKDTGKDEFSVIASKVGLLGARLRGAQDEASGLRSNIDRLFADLEDAVFLFNRDKELVFATGSVGKFLSNDRRTLSGHMLGDLFPPTETLGDLLDHAVTTGNTVHNRRVPYKVPPVVMLSVDILAGSGFLVRLRDPEAQRKLNRQLQTADRLAAISKISSGVAHEVKNPLNAILLHVEIARAKAKRGDADVTPEMDIIAREILRLDRVVRTFLDFSRPVELNLVNLPVHALVDEIVDLARPQAAAGKIRIDVRQDADSAEVRVDQDLMKQAVLNIVVNAMQAMPEGGELRFDSTVKEDTAEIRVSDTGAGIPPQLREKIFRLYFSTKEKGSGIGLAMTFRIVQLHDGTIDFTSEPGKGTTFLIRLPIVV
jgi:signal transduction histidine kinase